jgi:hypothetical protein
MLEELQRRNYSERTARIYVRTVKELAGYFGCSPAKLGPEQIRQYQVHLAQKKLAPKTIKQRAAALQHTICPVELTHDLSALEKSERKARVGGWNPAEIIPAPRWSG